MARDITALTVDFWRIQARISPTLVWLTCIPPMIYGSLYLLGVREWDDTTANAILHFACTLTHAVGITVTMLSTISFPRREYTLPVSTWKLVITRTVNGVVLVTSCYVVTSLLINWLFAAAWPIGGPALFIAAIYLAAQAVFWLFRHCGISMAVLAVPAIFGCWRWYYGCYVSTAEMVGSTDRMIMWREVSSGQLIFLISIIVASIAVSYVAASRERVGAVVELARLRDWLDGNRSQSGPAANAFGSATRALAWREWQERGRPIVIIFGLAALVHGAFWFTTRTEVTSSVFLTVGLSWMGTMTLALFGIYLGGRSPSQEFPSFMAAQPVTNAQWSWVVVMNTAKTVAASCALWLTLVSITLAVASLIGVHGIGREVRYHLGGGWQLVAAIGGWLLCCWICAANGMVAGLCRQRAMRGLMHALVWALLVPAFLLHLLLPDSAKPIGLQLWCVVVSTVVFLATSCAYGLAWRRGAISTKSFCAGTAAWVGLAAVTSWLYWQTCHQSQADFRPLVLISMVLASGLAVLPLAATPLVVAWNRHR